MSRKLLFLFVFTFVFSSTGLTAEPLYSGGWTLQGKGQSVTLVNPPFDDPMLFQLTCTELSDSDFAEFRVWADGRSYIPVLGEAGGAFVTGRQIHISQVGAGAPASCQWRIIERTETEQLSTTWSVPPDAGREVLVGAFAEPTRFRIDLNRVSTGCVDSTMTVFVDGKQVVDIAGRPQVFAAGSSFVGVGEVVAARVTGSCGSRDGRITGAFAIAR